MGASEPARDRTLGLWCYLWCRLRIASVRHALIDLRSPVHEGGAFTVMRWCVRRLLEVDARAGGCTTAPENGIEEAIRAFCRHHAPCPFDESRVDRTARRLSGPGALEQTGEITPECISACDRWISWMGEQVSARIERNKTGAARWWPAVLAGAGVVTGAAGWATLLAVRMLSPAGAVVTYYEGEQFNRQVSRRSERALARDYQRGSPAWFVPKEHFSARWEGVLVVPESGTYAFAGQGDDGYRFFIDGLSVLGRWQIQEWEQSLTRGQATLAAGPHPILLEHFAAGGTAAVRITWAGGPIAPHTIIAVPYLRKRR